MLTMIISGFIWRFSSFMHNISRIKNTLFLNGLAEATIKSVANKQLFNYLFYLSKLSRFEYP
jgi:hypothetical protein